MCIRDESSIKRDNGFVINSLEVQSAISGLKKGSNDPLFAPLKVFKRLKESMCIQLALLFSNFVLFQKLPINFKSAIITPLFKGKGSRQLSSNYRPISALNVYCKLFERILFNRIRLRVDSKLCEQQHAYRTVSYTHLRAHET